MDFRTQVHIPDKNYRIDHSTRMMLFGSCFSENIGSKLKNNKFNVEVNPFGILYNPLSVSNSIRRLLRKTGFTETDILYNNEMYHSFMHHGSFSDTDKDNCLKNINERYNKAVEWIYETELFLITFGTAYVYRLKQMGKTGKGEVVSNCHKYPADKFDRTILTVDEIVEEWVDLTKQLKAVNKNVKFLFTVSPIRHWKDGAHENQISKSILHIAIDQLIRICGEDLLYFPAYEIMIDELRDYRFYEDDMMHPSAFAVDYIWHNFSKTFFSDATMKINKEWSQIKKSIDHKPLFPKTCSYRNFLEQTYRNLNEFSNRNPQISCEKEIQKLTSLLNSKELD